MGDDVCDEPTYCDVGTDGTDCKQAVPDVLCGHGGRASYCQLCTTIDTERCNSVDCYWDYSVQGGTCQRFILYSSTSVPTWTVASTTTFPTDIGKECQYGYECPYPLDCMVVGSWQLLWGIEQCPSASSCLCSAAWVTVDSGICAMTPDQCVTSPYYPDFYTDRETCNISVSPFFEGTISAESFETGYASDYLYVNDKAYHGSTGPISVKPMAGPSIYWTSDGFAVSRGWKLCPDKLTTTSATTTRTISTTPSRTTSSASATSSSRTTTTTQTSSTSSTTTYTSMTQTMTTTTSTMTDTEACCCVAKEGDVCYREVLWAMNSGIVEQPQWYPGLTQNSSFVAFQAALHRGTMISCPDPCPADGDELMSRARPVEGAPMWIGLLLLLAQQLGRLHEAKT